MSKALRLDARDKPAHRQRYRVVSPQRIAKVAEALSARGAVHGVQLLPDGSALVLTDKGAVPITVHQGAGLNEWDVVLPGSA